MTTYRTSAGSVVKIVDMNPYHLHNAIKKLAAHKGDEHAETLAALRAEQTRRGGPPEGAK